MLVRCSRLHSFAVGVRHLFGTKPKMEVVNFCHLHLVVAAAQLPALFHRVSQPTDYFSIFYPALTLNRFSVWVSSNQSEPASNFAWYISIFKLWRLLLWWSGFQEPTFLSLSLSLGLPRLSFSYMVLTFPPSSGGSVNFARKQLTINRSP